MRYAIGVDIGGTKVATAIVNQKGEIVKQAKIATDLSVPPEEMVARINEQIDDLIHIANLSSLDISGIGIGSPLFTSVQAYINQFALNLAGCKTKVVSASLDQDAGVIGAATLCFTDS
ncbi:MAG TPA: ROK family protein [Bacillota bacterium]|nr:ROK family protein [Bacillota bacterium]